MTITETESATFSNGADHDDHRDADRLVRDGGVVEDIPQLLRTADCADPGPEVDLVHSLADEADLDALERIIGTNNLLPVAFLAEGVERQMPVGRVTTRTGGAVGTGWLVSNDILMTNNHVIRTKDSAKRQRRVQFNYQDEADGSPATPDTYDLDPDSLFYTNQPLDFTLVRVKCRRLWLPTLPSRLVPKDSGQFVIESIDEADSDLVGFTPNPDGPGLPGVSSGLLPPDFRFPTMFPVLPPLCIAPGTRWGRVQLPSGRVPLRRGMHLNVIQHPSGRRKEVSLQQNQLERIHANVVKYTSDTEPGSSGSPVFNNRWDIVALHHAGGDQSSPGVFVNNEGIRIDRIVADIRSQFAAGSGVRNALRI